MEALEEAHPQIKSLGAELIVVSPQTEGHSRIFVERKKLSMEVLCDAGSRVAEKYGLAFTLPEDLKKVYLQFNIDLSEYNGDDQWKLPVPARYIVDRDQTIRYAEVSPDYTVRPDPAHTIEALKKMIS